MHRILIIEDDFSLNNTLAYNLRTAGYTVDSAYNAKEAFEYLKQYHYILLILDINLPDGNGFELYSELKEKSNASIIFLTANDLENDIVKGFDLGADDYITKPFSVLELISRVRAILRRCSVDDRQDVIKLGQIVFDDSKHIVTSCGEECNLTFKEYELLKYLLKNKGMALTRENIILNVWGYDFEGESRTVDMHITTLRQKLGSCGNLIKTVRNVGYKAGE